MRILRAFGAALASLCAACAVHSVAPPADQAAPASNGAAPLYTAQERASLFGCSALTDSAMIIAEMKQKGTPIQDANAFFAGRPNSQLTQATVVKVYDDNVGNVWDYAVTFFGDCAARVSKVPRDRSGSAGFCMLNSMIATNAQASKAAGVPIEKVDRYFARFPGELPKAIIARVYAQSQNRAEAHAEAWNSCMAPISGS